MMTSKIFQLALAFLFLVGCSSDQYKNLRNSRDDLVFVADANDQGNHYGKRNLRVSDQLLAEERTFWGRELQDGSLSMPAPDAPDSPNEDDSSSPQESPPAPDPITAPVSNPTDAPVPSPTEAPAPNPTSPPPPPPSEALVPAPAPTRTCNSGRSCTSSSQCNCGTCRKNCGMIVCVVGICT